jgi:tRNA A37 threonylcarbamoyladenosine modification protein TsaB
LFVAQYQRRTGRLEERTATKLVEAREWLAALPAGSLLTGPGLHKWAASLPAEVEVAPPEVWNADAATLGQLAAEYAAAGQTVDPWRLAPRYYRSSAAEEKWARPR